LIIPRLLIKVYYTPVLIQFYRDSLFWEPLFGTIPKPKAVLPAGEVSAGDAGLELPAARGSRDAPGIGDTLDRACSEEVSPGLDSSLGLKLVRGVGILDPDTGLGLTKVGELGTSEVGNVTLRPGLGPFAPRESPRVEGNALSFEAARLRLVDLACLLEPFVGDFVALGVTLGMLLNVRRCDELLGMLDAVGVTIGLLTACRGVPEDNDNLLVASKALSATGLVTSGPLPLSAAFAITAATALARIAVSSSPCALAT
jgi:hypothetical protein